MEKVTVDVDKNAHRSQGVGDQDLRLPWRGNEALCGSVGKERGTHQPVQIRRQMQFSIASMARNKYKNRTKNKGRDRLCISLGMRW